VDDLTNQIARHQWPKSAATGDGPGAAALGRRPDAGPAPSAMRIRRRRRC